MVRDDSQSNFICGSCSAYIERLTTFVQQCQNSYASLKLNEESSVIAKVTKLEIEVSDTNMEFIDDGASNFTVNVFNDNDDFEGTMEVDNKDSLKESTPADISHTDEYIADHPEMNSDDLTIAVTTSNVDESNTNADDVQPDNGIETKPEAEASKKISYRKYRKRRKDRLRIIKKQCHVCGKRVIDLSSHIESHGETGHQCQFCDRICPNRRQLRIHMNRHTKEREYPCRYCDKIFYVWSSRKDHEKNVHEQERFQCDVCNAVYKFKAYLVAHKKLVHLGIRNLKCTKCDFSTSIKTRLLNHFRSIHTSERPYKCTVCDHLSNSNTGYYIHFQRHKKSGEATSYAIKCTYCEELFDKDTKLETHIVKAHPDRAVII